MTLKEIYEMAMQAGVLDPDLSSPDNWMTDYGNCETCLTKFAQLVAAHERERCIQLCTCGYVQCDSNT